MTVLKQHVLVGSAPAAALIKGPTIQEWAELNVLTNLDAMAAFYSNAPVQLDKRALAGDTMRQSLEVFRRLKSYVDDKAAGRD